MSSNKSSSFLCDFGINSTEVLSKAILTAPEASWKHNPEFLISISMGLSATLFGAIYLFSTSLIGMNKKWRTQKKFELTAFEILNGAIMFLSGGVVFFTSVRAFNRLLNK